MRLGLSTLNTESEGVLLAHAQCSWTVLLYSLVGGAHVR